MMPAIKVNVKDNNWTSWQTGQQVPEMHVKKKKQKETENIYEKVVQV